MSRFREILAQVSRWLIGWAIFRRLWLVVGIAFLLRMLIVGVVIMTPQQALQVDSPSYLKPAWNMLTQGKFSQDTASPYTPDVLRTPCYPAFLALFMLFFGKEPYVSIVLAQALIGALTSAGVLLLGQKLFDSPTCGLVAGMLNAISPMQSLMVGWVMTETLFTALLVCGLLLLVNGFQHNKWWMFGLGGLIFGVATLARPIGLWMLVPLVLALLLYSLPHPKWQPSVLFVLGYLLIACLWMGRNYIHFGRLSLSSAMDYHLYYYAVPGFVADRQGMSLEQARQSLEDRLAEYPRLDDPWPLAKEGALAKQIILERPLDFAVYNGVGSVLGLTRPGFSFALFMLSDENNSAREEIDVFASGNPLSVVRMLFLQGGWILILHLYMLIYTWGLIGLSLVGLVVIVIQRRWYLVSLLGLLSAFMLYPPGFWSNARYRSPVEILLVPLAVVGLSWLWKHFTKTPIARSLTVL